MILYFPDLDTLRLALTSGAVPPAVGLAPVAAGFDDQGHVWLRPSAPLPRPALADLRELGVQPVKAVPAPVVTEFFCWPQALPLGPDPVEPALSAQAPVLFELPRPDLLPALVGEILRLGNDRQGFRWLRDEGERPRGLL